MYGADMTALTATSTASMRGDAAFAGLQTEAGRLAGDSDEALRERVGEFVGGVFYGMLLRQMEASKFKGEYMHGGRGEEVFRGQLNQELARRLGSAKNDPIANALYGSIKRSLTGVEGPTAAAPENVASAEEQGEA
jgi:hypothetical protein